MRSRILVVLPPRVYGLDAVVPLLCELKASCPETKVVFLVWSDRGEKDLERNPVLRDLVREIGAIKKISGIAGWDEKWHGANRVLKFMQLLPELPRLFLSLTLLFCPFSIRNFFARLLRGANSFRGRTYCYLQTVSSFREDRVINFNPDGSWRAGARVKHNVHDTADGLIAYHPDNEFLLNRVGYVGRKVFVGYPFLFPAYQRWIRERSQRYLEAYHPGVVGKRICAVFLNKFTGRWAGHKNDTWARDKLLEVAAVLRKRNPGAAVLLRAHPMLGRGTVEGIVSSSPDPIVVTELHPAVLACVSECVINIAQSSSVLQVMAFGTPCVDYGRMDAHVYDLFPSGSMYAELGVKVALSPVELDKAFDELAAGNDGLEFFRGVINSSPNLSEFEGFFSGNAV